MAAFSVIFTLAGLCFGSINAMQSCSPSQQFKDSVNFQQCKTEAVRKLSKTPPPYFDNRFNKANSTENLPFCDYLQEIETECLQLYSPECHPGKAFLVLQNMWIRQELEQSFSVFPRDQYFKCETTKRFEM